MKWMVVASHSFGRVGYVRYRVFETREEAMAFVDEKKLDDSCYCAELYEHAGCYHAVG